MLKALATALLVIVSTTAFAGIIGVGGTNALQNPDLMEALRYAKRFEVNDSDYRRLSVRVGESGEVNQEVTSTSGEKIRRSFIRVFVDRESKIVDKNVKVDVQPSGQP